MPRVSTRTAGVFEPLLDERDAIISDALNHASIIDGVRLCKAVRYRYANADMDELEHCLKLAQAQRFRVIVTDGVFSMDGNVAPMDRICALAERYDALVMVDECHSAGVVGPTGRGVTELFGLRGRVDIITGTLGKAFGGAIGGFTTGRREIVEMLRQRSRPYLFSNSLPPAVVGAGIEVFRMLSESDALHDRLTANVERFRGRMLAAGFDIKPDAVGDLRRDALRREAVAGLCRTPVGRGHLRDGFLLPGRTEGSGADSRAGVGRAYRAGAGPLRRRFRESRTRAGRTALAPRSGSGRKSQARRSGSILNLTNGIFMAKISLDAIDRKILGYLIKNARMPFLEIARECGISGAAIHQRVKKLEDAGVIRGSRLEVNPKALGYDVCAIIGIRVSDPTKNMLTVEKLRQVPEITECHFITGKYNILVKLYCTDNEHLMHTIFDHILQLPEVSQTETFISLSESFGRQVEIPNLGDE